MAISNLIIEPTDIFVKYYYKVTEFFVLLGGKITQIPVERISGIKIENDYDQAIFPIFRMEVTLEPSIYYGILKEKQTVRFKLRIQKFYKKEGLNDPSLDTDFINDIFVLFPDEDDVDYERNLKKEGKTDKDLNVLEKVNNVVELFLFKESVIGLRSKYNTTLTKCDVATAMTHLLERAGVTNVLMSPVENLTKYNQIPIPNIHLEKSMRMLNNSYGLYRKGGIIFFGLLRNYILNYRAACTAFMKNEWKETTIVMLDKTNTKSYLSGSFIKKNEKKYYFNATSDGIDTKQKSVSNNLISGVNPNVIDPRLGTVQQMQTKTVTVGQQNAAMIYNTDSNVFWAETMQYQFQASSNPVTLVLEDINIEAFEPNKDFSMIFEDPMYSKKFNGKYKLSQSIFTFSNSGDHFNVSGAFVFMKAE